MTLSKFLLGTTCSFSVIKRVIMLIIVMIIPLNFDALGV